MKRNSKTAAKSRREKENSEFDELARLLPLPSAIASQLDKASLVRLTSSYLHLRNRFPDGLQSYASQAEFFDFPEIPELGSQLMQTLEGFVFILSLDGRVIYISETASAYLGLSQVELTGNNIFEYLHPADQSLMANVLQKELDINTDFGDTCEFEMERNFTIRLRCILAKRNAGLTYHGYKVVHCAGFIKFKLCRTMSGAPAIQQGGLAAMGTTLPANSATEYKLAHNSFLLRMSLDLKIIFLDARVADLTGYDPQELLDCSLYSYVHAFDAIGLRETHKCLLEKCQSMTGYYRFLGKNGAWIWIQSQMALIHNARSSRPHCIVCVNHVISSDVATMDACKSTDTQKPTKELYFGQNTNKCTGYNAENSLVGAYSEQFYGPSGVLLVTGQ